MEAGVVGPHFFFVHRGMSIPLEQLSDELESRLAAIGFEVVDVRKGGGGSRTRLQVRIDWLNAAPGRKVTIEDCATASRHLEAWLDASGVLGPKYVLEVSSPGMERPLRRLAQWARFVGREADVRLPDRGRVRARITAVDSDAGTVTLLPRGGDAVTIPAAEARDATLVVDWEAMLRSGGATPSRDEQDD
jgi:ribosome maturation factor RimP